MESQPMGGTLNQPPAYQNRLEAMNQGINGGPTTSPGLAADQQSMAAQQPRGIRPALSSNGMAASTYSSTMGGQFPTQNAMAEDQYNQAKFMMRKD